MASRTGSIFIGIRGTVVAVDRKSGKTQWETSLAGADFVQVTLEADGLYAASKGRLYHLDPVSGEILWRNELPGLGYGIVSIAGTSPAGVAERAARQRQAAAVVVASSSAS